MIFGPDLLPKVLDGSKTVTRRRVKYENGKERGCAYRRDGLYAVQPGRGRRGVGQLRVLTVSLDLLGSVDDADAHREGFACRADFVSWWERQYGSFDPMLPVWRIEFELERAFPLSCPECGGPGGTQGGRCFECRGRSML